MLIAKPEWLVKKHTFLLNKFFFFFLNPEKPKQVWKISNSVLDVGELPSYTPPVLNLWLIDKCSKLSESKRKSFGSFEVEIQIRKKREKKTTPERPVLSRQTQNVSLPQTKRQHRPATTKRRRGASPWKKWDKRKEPDRVHPKTQAGNLWP